MLRALSDAPATGNPSFVIPAKAGIQCLFAKNRWITAFIGMARKDFPATAKQKIHLPHPSLGATSVPCCARRTSLSE
jgi:hypothetical protein